MNDILLSNILIYQRNSGDMDDSARRQEKEEDCRRKENDQLRGDMDREEKEEVAEDALSCCLSGDDSRDPGEAKGGVYINLDMYLIICYCAFKLRNLNV